MTHDAWALSKRASHGKNEGPVFDDLWSVTGMPSTLNFCFSSKFPYFVWPSAASSKKKQLGKSLKLHTTFLVSSFLSFIFARKSIFIPITTRAMVLETMKKTSKTMDAFILVQKRHWVRIWAQITRWENEKPSSQKWETVLDVDASTNLFYPRGRIVT